MTEERFRGGVVKGSRQHRGLMVVAGILSLLAAVPWFFTIPPIGVVFIILGVYLCIAAKWGKTKQQTPEPDQS